MILSFNVCAKKKEPFFSFIKNSEIWVSINKGSETISDNIKSDSTEFIIESEVSYQDRNIEFWEKLFLEDVKKIIVPKFDDMCGCLGTQPIVTISFNKSINDTIELILNDCGIDYSRGKLNKNGKSFIIKFNEKGMENLKKEFSKLRNHFFRKHSIDCGE